MSYQPKPNTWVLFKNSHKKDDTHPDYAGNVTLEAADGTTATWKLTGWKRTSKAGVPFLGGFIRPETPNLPAAPAAAEKDHSW